MQNLQEIKNHFLKNDLNTRLGCIASDLARIESFSQTPNNRKVINDLIEESKFFIEWTAKDASLELQEELVDLQIKLALLNYSSKQKEITNFTHKWANRILELSGLVK